MRMVVKENSELNRKLVCIGQQQEQQQQQQQQQQQEQRRCFSQLPSTPRPETVTTTASTCGSPRRQPIDLSCKCKERLEHEPSKFFLLNYKYNLQIPSNNTSRENNRQKLKIKISVWAVAPTRVHVLVAEHRVVPKTARLAKVRRCTAAVGRHRRRPRAPRYKPRGPQLCVRRRSKNSSIPTETIRGTWYLCQSSTPLFRIFLILSFSIISSRNNSLLYTGTKWKCNDKLSFNQTDQLACIETEVRTLQAELRNTQRERQQLEQQRKLLECAGPCATCCPEATKPSSNILHKVCLDYKN